MDLKEKMDEIAKSQTRLEKIYQPVDGWIIEYPDFVALADSQMHSFWPHNEPEVENDIQDLRVYAVISERHGILSVLKLFTHYEKKAGDDFWSSRVAGIFKRPEIQRMATMFSCVEFNSHAPFYNKINEALFVDSAEFYSDWRNDPNLVDRMKFIDAVINAKDDLVSVGAFVFVEGTILYSSFAFLKHFQVQSCGKNLITNICRGVNLSAGDENLHAVGSSTLFKTILSERNLSTENYVLLKEIIFELAQQVYEHESHIVDLIFSQGAIKGITAQNLKDFVKHRINVCLELLNMPNLFNNNELDGYIASWFYADINAVQFHDFFTGTGSEYHLNWTREKFGKVWEGQENV